MFRIALLGVVATGTLACADDGVRDGGVLLLWPRDPDSALTRLRRPIAGYLEELAGSAPRVVSLGPGDDEQVVREAERTGAGLVIVADAHQLAADVVRRDASTDRGAGSFTIVTRDVGDWANRLASRGATVLYTAAPSKLGRQYALYEVLRRLGARFYHPEQEHVPTNPPRQLRERARTPTAVARKDSHGQYLDRYEPDFAERSYTFHGAHPLEHLEAFSDGDHPIREAVDVNDWIVKNRGNLFRGAGRGIAGPAARARRVATLDELRRAMGFSRGAGITLHNQQQGANAAVDPDSSIPARQQIESYVAKQLRRVPDAKWFGIHFGPTEFTVTPDRQTVDWIDWAGRKALAIDPDIRVVVNSHITGDQATQHYGDLGCPPGTNASGKADYYDLAFHTDKRFAVKVHTVMFYPLEGPAFVYNQKSFAHKLCLMKKASAAGRPLSWFPEGSWWLSFDNPIPVYLPLYIWSRWRDVQLLKPLLAARGSGTVYAHRMFNSGQEWGYWQQDYAVGLLHWNSDLKLGQLLDELLDPLCAPAQWRSGCKARRDARTVLEELIAYQRRAYLQRTDHRGKPGGLYSYMAGEDPADELAASTGFAFRPVRVSFSQVARWDKKQLEHFRETDLAALAEMDRKYSGWVAQLRALRDDVPDAGRVWLDEIIDGVEIDELRARQAHELYSAVIAFRSTQLAAGRGAEKTAATLAAAAKAAKPLLERASKTLTAAQTVIHRREESYRYPLAQEIGGGVTKATAVANGTTYPYRVHTKTHLLTYWNNRHERAKALIEGHSGSDSFRLTPVFGDPGDRLKVRWPSSAGVKATVSIGTQRLTQDDEQLDLGAKAGFWRVSGSLSVADRQLALSGGVVRSSLRARSATKGFSLTKPSSSLAQSVLSSVFPPMIWALLETNGQPSALVFAPDLDGDKDADYDDVVYATVASVTGAAFATKPVALSMPIADPRSKVEAATLGLSSVVVRGQVDKSGKPAGSVAIAGKMAVGDLVDALIALAGFDRKGALQILASVLDFDAKSPPTKVAFEGTLKLE